MNLPSKRLPLALCVCVILLFSCSTDSKTLSVNPSTVDFEDVYIGDFSEIEVTLSNKFGKDIVIHSFDYDGSNDFIITSGGTVPIDMPPTAEHKFTVRFSPNTNGLIEGSISISHDGSENTTFISLKGKGVVCARIDFSEKSYDFQQKTINKTHTHDFDITNIGTDDLNVTGLNLIGSGATAYKITSAPITIAAGSKETITLTFEPTALMTYDADLIIEHNAVNEDASFTFPVTGEGRNLDPQITLNQSSPWDFGNVTINKSSIQVCEIENTGIDILNVTSATLQTGAEFTIESVKDSNGGVINLPKDIAIGDKISLEIKFSPSAVNTFNDTLSIVHNGTNETSPLVVSLEGEGVLQQGFDFNGDGFSDVIVGARGDDDGGSDSGCSFIFFGSATPSSSINAAQADVKIVGEDSGDQLGFVSDAGDFNDDGFDDVIVGARCDDDGGTDSGSAYIIFGSATPPSTIDASNANVKLVGTGAGDKFGSRVYCAGDFNNDGIDDVIVGAIYDDDGGIDSGCAFIFFGSKTPSTLISASAADVKIVGEDAGDQFTHKVCTAGDFNNDGIDDVIIGANKDDDGGAESGCAFIFYGSSTPASLIDASAANVKIVGQNAGDMFGYTVSRAGDFNSDGIDDVVIGAHYDDDGGTDSGCAFIFFGSNNPTTLMNATAADVKLIGGGAGDRFGTSVHTAGDFNNDGYDDVIIGAWNDDDGGADSGCSFIYFGSATPSASINTSAANVKLVGAGSGDMFGASVGFAGDFNNDGYNDVIVGAYQDDDGGTNSGCAFIFLGSATPSALINASAANVKFVGANAGDILYYIF